MSRTRATMVTNVRAFINDSSTTSQTFSDATLTKWLNTGLLWMYEGPEKRVKSATLRASWTANSPVLAGDATCLYPEILEVAINFTYDSTMFQEPVTRDRKVMLYRHNRPMAGAGDIEFTFYERGRVLGHPTWYADYIGEIAFNSDLERVCEDKHFQQPAPIQIKCVIFQEPLPHA